MAAAGKLKPRDEDIDVYGLTHVGKVRKENQDHFLIGSLTKRMEVDRTSLPPEAELAVEPERLASLAMVADGVSRGGGGEEASRVAVHDIAQYVARSTSAFYAWDAEDSEAFTGVLTDAALQCHMSLLERSENDPDHKQYGTTLTLWLGLWPHAYLLQVGDSRAYMYRDGQLTQISRDQTMAQDLVDQGVLTRTGAFSSRWAHVLSSAIGGQQAAPVAASDDPQTAVALGRVVERQHHIGQPIDMGTAVIPVRRILVPAEARALARALEVDPVGEERHPLVAHQFAHGLHQARVVDASSA